MTVGVPACLLGGLWLGAFVVRDESGARAATLVTVALAAGVLGAAALVTLRTASTGIGGEQATTRFEIPLLPRAGLDAFLARLMGSGDWTVPPITPRAPAARRRGVVRRTLLLLAAAAVPAVPTRPGGLVLLSLALLGPPWGLVAHRRAGLGLGAALVATSHGVLHHRIDLVPVARIQSCRTTATPLQRANRLATLHLDVAGAPRAPLLYDLEREIAGGTCGRCPGGRHRRPRAAQGVGAWGR